MVLTFTFLDWANLPDPAIRIEYQLRSVKELWDGVDTFRLPPPWLDDIPLIWAWRGLARDVASLAGPELRSEPPHARGTGLDVGSTCGATIQGGFSSLL